VPLLSASNTAVNTMISIVVSDDEDDNGLQLCLPDNSLILSLLPILSDVVDEWNLILGPPRLWQ
jgi:hypothetical protein